MNNRLVGCLIIGFLAGSVRAIDIAGAVGDAGNIGADLINAGISNGVAIVKQVPKLIPDPTTIMMMGIEKFLGLPPQIALAVFDEYCNIALSGGSAAGKNTPDIDKMGLILMKENSTVRIPLNQPERLMNHSDFNRNLPMVIYVAGFLSFNKRPNILSAGAEESVPVLSTAYAKHGGYNFVVLDTGGYLFTVYSWASFNTDAIGRYLGEAVVIIQASYPLENIHLMGHSLGAQIVGSAGYYFNKITGLFIPRITGLDPANPCFREGETLSGISRGVAGMVDIIHTNNGVFGQKKPVGDIDFYPNGVVAVQPGCIGILGTLCSHNRAWEYYAETVYPGNEDNFLATRCDSLKALNADMCNGRRISMGFACPTNETGRFFLRTRSSSPFGENSRGS